MKKLLLLALITFSTLFSACLFEDDEEEWDAAKVCPEAGTNAYGMPNRGTFVDERDGRVYKYTTIGNQVWMAENLKYEAENSECKEVFDGFCEIFGRYYSLAENGKYIGILDTSVSNHVCPEGWHVPAKEEWNLLFRNIGGNDDELTMLRLKSRTFWGIAREAGNDTCSIDILPAGSFGSNKSYSSLFFSSHFAVNENFNDFSYGSYYISSDIEYNNTGILKMSIRCLKD